MTALNAEPGLRPTGRPPDAPIAGPSLAETGRASRVDLRAGVVADAPAIVRLIDENLAAGHLLRRAVDEVAVHAHRFVVVADGHDVVGCAELAPLSLAVAEVRSLVVDRGWRGLGLGARLVATLQRRARLEGFSTLCALTHEPGRFVRLGFSIAPLVWFPEKIAIDCTSCARFRACGQYAVALSLGCDGLDPPAGHRRIPLVAGPPQGLRAFSAAPSPQMLKGATS